MPFMYMCIKLVNLVYMCTYMHMYVYMKVQKGYPILNLGGEIQCLAQEQPKYADYVHK